MKNSFYFWIFSICLLGTLLVSCGKNDEPKPAPSPDPTFDSDIPFNACWYEYGTANNNTPYVEVHLVNFRQGSNNCNPELFVRILGSSLTGEFSTSIGTVLEGYLWPTVNTPNDAYITLQSVEMKITPIDGAGIDRYNFEGTIATADTTYKIKWSGIAENSRYNNEEFDARDVTIEFKSALYDSTIAKNDPNKIYLTISLDTLTKLMFFVQELDTNTIIPTGTYNVSMSTNIGTLAASLGAVLSDEEKGYYTLYPCYVRRIIGNYDYVWFITGGSLNVSLVENSTDRIMISGTLTSYYGSSFTIRYEGRVLPYVRPHTLPAKINNRKAKNIPSKIYSSL